MTEAYPLQWPNHVPRTPSHKRERSRFDATPSHSRDMLFNEIGRMGSHPVVSTNQELRRDGLPYASRCGPNDVGVAVYFMRKGNQVCIACDKYQKVWENMRGIAKTIEAMRGIERWGSSELLDQAFKGFTALPPPNAMNMPQSRAWWVVLDCDANSTNGDIKAAWKAKIRTATDAEKLDLNLARDEGLASQL